MSVTQARTNRAQPIQQSLEEAGSYQAILEFKAPVHEVHAEIPRGSNRRSRARGERFQSQLRKPVTDLKYELWQAGRWTAFASDAKRLVGLRTD